MIRRALSATLACALSFLALSVPTRGQQDSAMVRARAILKQVPLIDGHNDYPWNVRSRADHDPARLDIRTSQPSLMTDIPRLRAGGVGGQFWSVYVPPTMAGQEAVTAALEQIDIVYRMAERYPDVFELARTGDEVERIFRSGKIASIIGMEGGHSIGDSLGALRMFARLGARYMTLTHGKNVSWADSATDKPEHNGLTRFGEEVVREMNRLGMLVDLSHVSPKVMDDALRVSAAPVIFSHSSARALCDVPRNVPDSVLSQMQRNGGVVMVSFVTVFTSPEAAAWQSQYDAEGDRLGKLTPGNDSAIKDALEAWQKAHPQPPVSVAQVADHIDHVRKVAGIDHVGIGSDFDGISSAPKGLEDVSRFPVLVAELIRRGYTDDQVKKVVGLNVLRAMRAAEQVARRLQAERPPSSALISQLDGKR